MKLNVKKEWVESRTTTDEGEIGAGIMDVFDLFFDTKVKYTPDPISIEGYKAYLQKKPLDSCPYMDSKRKELWEHGWIVTDIGHFKASQFFGDYDDPKNWGYVDKLKKLYKKRID